MTNKYSELAAKINEARVVGKVAAEKVKDEGSCNLDKVVIRGLPRVRESSLINAGIGCYKHWSYAGAFVLSGSFGMADKNMAGVQAMADYLKSVGVDCYINYRMD